MGCFSEAAINAEYREDQSYLSPVHQLEWRLKELDSVGAVLEVMNADKLNRCTGTAEEQTPQPATTENVPAVELTQAA